MEKINEELELAERKKQALDKLLSTGRILRSTYDRFHKELNNSVTEIKALQSALVKKIASKVAELEWQAKVLETFLAKMEIQYVGGEMSEESYEYERAILTLGLEATKREAAYIKEDSFNLITLPSVSTEVVKGARIEKSSKAKTVTEPTSGEREIGWPTKTPAEEVKAAPEISAEVLSKELVTGTVAEKESRVRRTRESPTREVLAEKVKELPSEKPLTKTVHSREALGKRCRNPWNSKCENTDINVFIYFKDELLPICRNCWRKIADKSFEW